MKIDKHLSFILLVVISLSGLKMQAQQEVVDNSESVIVMSEDDIVSLAMKLQKLKKDYLHKKAIATSKGASTDKSTFEVEFLRSQVAQLENSIKNNSVAKDATTTDYKTDDVQQQQLNLIKQDINQLKDLIGQLVVTTKNEVTIKIPSTADKTKTEVLPVVVSKQEEKPVTDKESLILKNKLDSLTLVFKNYKETNYSADYTNLEKQITVLKNELALKNAVPNTYDQLVATYKGYHKNIFFSNNSTDINEEGVLVITELNEILAKNNNIDIVVKGFASNKGVALYNENLSMMRTESVKKALISKGIHPIRVLTQYHGIDYKATDEIARRVEILILVRK